MSGAAPTDLDEPAAPLSELTRNDLQQRALRGSLWSFALVAVSLPLGLVANAIIARQLQPTEYGELAALLVVYTIALQASDFGFLVAQTQWGVQAATTGDEPRKRQLLSQGLGYRLLVQFPLIAIIGLVALRNSSLGAQVAWVVIGLAGIPPASVSMSLLFQNRSATIGRISTIATCFVQVGVVAVAVSAAAAIPVLLARMALDLIGPMFSLFAVGRRDRSAGLRPRLPTGMPAGFWRFATLSGTTVVLHLLVYSRSEVFVFRLYDEVAAAGVFALAFGLTQQLMSGVDVLIAPLMPAVAGLVAAHPEHAWRGTLRALRLVALLAGGVVSLLPAVVFAVPVLFGEAYSEAAHLLVPLGVTAAFQSLTGPIVALAYARRRGTTLVAANATALAADLLLAFMLIPLIGLWAGVIASVLARLISITVLVADALRSQDIQLVVLAREVRPWLLAIASIPASLTAGGAAAQVAGSAGGAAIALAVTAVWYASLLRLSGGALRSDDADALLEVVPTRAHRLLRAGLGVVGIRRA